MSNLMSGSKILLECLVREGVDTIYGYPGGVTIPFYDALFDHPIRHVLVRHEQNAAFAAQGYVRATGKTFRITRGTCATQAGNFFAQIGTIGGRRQGAFQRLPLFYLLTDLSAPAKNSILYWIVDGKRYAAAPGVRITQQKRTVTFSGRLIKAAGYSGSGAFSGSLAC